MIRKTIIEIKKINEILSKRQRIFLYFVFLFAILAAGFETLGVTIIIPIVKLMITPEELFNNPKLEPIISFMSINDINEMIVLIIGGTIVFFIVKNLYMIFFSWIKARYATKIQREVATYMMESYMNRGYTFFLKNNSSDIIQGVTGDTMSLYTILNMIIIIFVKLFMVVLISIYMIYTDWILALGIVIASMVCLFVLVFCLKQPMKKTGVLLREYAMNSTQLLLQAIYGIKEVMVMRKQNAFIDQFKNKMYLRQKQEIKRAVFSDSPNCIIEAFCVSAIMIVLSVRMLTSDDMSDFIIILASFVMGAFRILPAIGVISGSFGTIISNKPGLDSIYENIIEARRTNDSFDDINVRDDEVLSKHEFGNSIVISNLTFRYSENLDYVLENLSLEIKKNTSVALVGGSGAGKSTLADLILGILKYEKGSIKIDDIDIRQIPNKWSSMIGYVPQSIYLSALSIEENVAFGERKEKINHERVKKVLEMANICDFVDSLPKGVQTIVGERGVRLSGGQRQRIGIARALYHNPEILILDEATSALDNETEQNVMQAIDSLQGQITIIIIAHRLTTIKKCDKIYEIVNGKAIERRYEELI